MTQNMIEQLWQSSGLNLRPDLTESVCNSPPARGRTVQIVLYSSKYCYGNCCYRYKQAQLSYFQDAHPIGNPMGLQVFNKLRGNTPAVS